MKKTPATDKVAAFLEEEKSDLINKKFGRSVIDEIDRLLDCGDSLESAYHEMLESAGSGFPPGMSRERWKLAVMELVEAAAGWDPSDIKETRKAILRIGEINAEISEKAIELAALLRKRSELSERNGGIENPGNPLVYELLAPAAHVAGKQPEGVGHTGYLYEHHVEKHISALMAQFDWKYWPRCADLLEALAAIQNVEPIARDEFSAAAIEGSRESSNLDFMRSFDKGLDNLSRRHDTKVRLSNSAYSALVNAALGLDGEITPENVKTYRYREKKRPK
jgi:hypothetical protein